ncbi:MAG: transposase, partial [Desulfobulbus sp.]
MKHKLQQTMNNRDDQYRLAGNILMDDAYWGGKKGDGKRGRGATGKMPFVAALSLTEEGFPLFIKFNQVQQFTLKEISAWSVKYIRPGSSVLTDSLGCFPGVAA